MGAQQFPHFFYPASRRSHCQIGKGAARHLCSREEMIQQKGSTLRFAFEASLLSRVGHGSEKFEQRDINI